MSGSMNPAVHMEGTWKARLIFSTLIDVHGTQRELMSTTRVSRFCCTGGASPAPSLVGRRNAGVGDDKEKIEGGP